MTDVIAINRDKASKACAGAIYEFSQNLKALGYDSDFYAMKMMELSVFSAMVVSNLFKDMEEQDDEENVSVNN